MTCQLGRLGYVLIQLERLAEQDIGRNSLLDELVYGAHADNIQHMLDLRLSRTVVSVYKIEWHSQCFL